MSGVPERSIRQAAEWWGKAKTSFLFHARGIEHHSNGVQNSLGTINPVKELVGKAHEAGAVVLIDAAQSAPHTAIDVRDMDADFLAFSGHKMLGPTGIGVLYGKAERLAALPPYQGGGEMIDLVELDRSTYAKVPHKFEAGTPNVGGAVGIAAH